MLEALKIGIRHSVVPLSIFLCVIFTYSLSYRLSEAETTITIESKDIKAGVGDGKYLVWTESGGVFSIQDSAMYWSFDSSDRYGELEIGKTYRVKTAGWRIPFFSMYPNIIEAVPVTE